MFSNELNRNRSTIHNSLIHNHKLLALNLLGELVETRASLTMAIVHHEVQFFPHAVLLVEMNTGTWVLDNLYDEVMCWDAVPYRYERREQPNGEWLRFAQF